MAYYQHSNFQIQLVSVQFKPVGISWNPSDATFVRKLFDGSIDDAAFERVENLRNGVRNFAVRPFLVGIWKRTLYHSINMNLMAQRYDFMDFVKPF
jgi:hypothetical protein